MFFKTFPLNPRTFLRAERKITGLSNGDIPIAGWLMDNPTKTND
jgi:hypothetical protein